MKVGGLGFPPLPPHEIDLNLRGCDPSISGECARLRPCASRRGLFAVSMRVFGRVHCVRHLRSSLNLERILSGNLRFKWNAEGFRKAV